LVSHETVFLTLSAQTSVEFSSPENNAVCNKYAHVGNVYF